jgi:hypothetical protein
LAETNEEVTPVPMGADHTRVEMGGATLTYMKLIM